MTFELHYDLISGCTLNFSFGCIVFFFFSIGGVIAPLHPLATGLPTSQVRLLLSLFAGFLQTTVKCLCRRQNDQRECLAEQNFLI